MWLFREGALNTFMIARKKTKPLKYELSDFDLGWVVGILEGEGRFCTNISPRGYLSTQIFVASTDQDVILRLEELIPDGKTTYVKTYDNHYKTQYSWSLNKRAACRGICKLIQSHMSSRRSDRIQLMIETIDNYENKKESTLALV